MVRRGRVGPGTAAVSNREVVRGKGRAAQSKDRRMLFSAKVRWSNVRRTPAGRSSGEVARRIVGPSRGVAGQCFVTPGEGLVKRRGVWWGKGG